MPPTTISRRHLFRMAGFFGAGSLAPARLTGAAEPFSPPTRVDTSVNVYKSIGVRPLINCRGTFTIIGGSTELAEVREAKSAANQQYVQLDELMDAVGARLAELTQSEWGMVSAGCAAAISHATAACVAGGNPDLHVRIPNLAGFDKDEVIIPAQSRNVYDAAIRALGVKVVEVSTPEALDLAIGPRTAVFTPGIDARRLATCSHRPTHSFHSASWSRLTQLSTATSMPTISSRPTFMLRAYP